MIESVTLTITGILPEIDAYKLAGYCIPYPEGGIFRAENGNKVYQVHPSHIRGVQKLIKKLGDVKPQLDIKKKVEGTIIVAPNQRDKMPLTITMVENGYRVIDKKHDHFVPTEDIDILWGIIKSKAPLHPRQVWSALASEHKLFPELDEIIRYIKDSSSEMKLNHVTKEAWITALFQRKASAFEGLRVKKEGQDDNTYYTLYWFGVLILKKVGLVEQAGSKELSLTDKGKETQDWKMCIK